jgi:hypothetical protein
MPGINDGLGFEEVNKELTFTEILKHHLQLQTILWH